MLSDTKKYLHRCPACRKSYMVRINVGILAMHSASCPHCSSVNYFDNRDGSLGRISSARNGSSQTGNVYQQPAAAPKFSQFNAHPNSEKNYNSELRDTRNTFNSHIPKRESYKSHSDRRISFKKRKLNLFQTPGIFSNISFRSIRSAGLLAVFLLFCAGIIYGLYSYLYTADFKDYAAGMEGLQANHVVDRNGEVIAELFAEKTGSIKKGDVPEELKKIIIFVEDENFYSHGGVHIPSIIRALIKNITSMGYSQGGSTITQQLARNLMKVRQKTIFRKIREARFAGYLEDHFSKEEILLGYMNHVYLGHGAVGMDTAAKFYFDKELSRLNFTEMLILASLPSAPEKYSPIRNPAKIEKKMDLIFKRMKDEEFPSPSGDEYEGEKQAVFKSIVRGPSETVFGSRINDAPWVGEYVRLRLVQLFGDEYQYGAGLTIETTINKKLQLAAKRKTSDQIRSLSKYIRPVRYDDEDKIKWDLSIEEKLRKAYFDIAIGAVIFGLPQPSSVRVDLQSASIGINPQTGEILFMQGGSEFTSKNQFNRALYMRRQTGSAIKPIVYSAAIARGTITAATPLDDTPLFQEERRNLPNDKGYWLPDNITGVYEGRIPARKALAFSKNIPAIRVARMTGLPVLAEQFKKFFFFTPESFESRFRYDDTVAIGSLEMSPLDMALAFSAFGNNGVMRRPYLIRSIKNSSGEELFNGVESDEFKLGMPLEQTVMSGDVAEVMASMMGDAAMGGGTGLGGSLIGKTGTTNNNRDAWFVGLLPGLSAAVWVGFDDPEFSMPGTTGASSAGPLFGNIVSGYSSGKAFAFEPRARQIEVCAESGELPTQFCPKRKTDIFTRATGPAGTCPIHVSGSKRDDWTINKKSDFD